MSVTTIPQEFRW